MSKISTVYDTILTQLAALYPNKTRIPNAYSLEDNNSRFVSDGYGLKIDASAAADSEFCTFSVEYGCSIVFTEEFYRLDSDADPLDTAVKSLLEDAKTLQENFLDANQLGIESSIVIINVGGISGIETFIGERNNFVSLEVNMLIQITENLS